MPWKVRFERLLKQWITSAMLHAENHSWAVKQLPEGFDGHMWTMGETGVVMFAGKMRPQLTLASVQVTWWLHVYLAKNSSPKTYLLCSKVVVNLSWYGHVSPTIGKGIIHLNLVPEVTTTTGKKKGGGPLKEFWMGLKKRRVERFLWLKMELHVTEAQWQRTSTMSLGSPTLSTHHLCQT